MWHIFCSSYFYCLLHALTKLGSTTCGCLACYRKSVNFACSWLDLGESASPLPFALLSLATVSNTLIYSWAEWFLKYSLVEIGVYYLFCGL